MKKILQELLQLEEELQFDQFDEGHAWELGKLLVEKAQRENLSVTIDIRKGEHQLFHYSCAGTAPDNDAWVKRKVALVKRFLHSSFYMGQLLKSRGKSIEEAFLVSEKDYAAHGGCFPIILKGSGVIGTLTISGLAQEEDHRMAVQAIRDFLKNPSSVVFKQLG